MANINSILDQRMKKPSNTSKMAALAKQSSEGQLTSFAGVFSVADLSPKEKETLQELLRNYAHEEQSFSQDLDLLISITSEVKAINNQAALLHGERIKKAQRLLIQYREGAFTAWLIAAYGNRQTPYNLMQYYEFCEVMPKYLRPQIELMPRQAVYVLASRSGSAHLKQNLVENYKGETKSEMLSLIRQAFPLDKKDKRRPKMASQILQALEKVVEQLKLKGVPFTHSEKKQILSLLNEIQKGVEKT